MKTKHYIWALAGIVLLLLSGCKRDNWADWKVQNEIWLEQNRIQHANDSTFHYVEATGLQYRILYPGNKTDARPSISSTVTCTYEGYLINGNKFDGGTSTFSVSGLIPGFAEAIKQIHNHGDIEIYVPYQLGYSVEAGQKEDGFGTEGTSSYIPPYSTLIFKVHLGAVN